MCALVQSNNQNSSSTEVAAMNLVQDHAYSLINVMNINLKNGKIQGLVQIRNPHASKEWCGDWHDKDPRWVDEFYKN